MASVKNPTVAIKNAAEALPNVVTAMSCNQTSYKAGRTAFLYIGPGTKGIGYKAMFKLDASRKEAQELASSRPNRYKIGVDNWVAIFFSDNEPLPKKIWSRWLKESYACATKGRAAKK